MFECADKVIMKRYFDWKYADLYLLNESFRIKKADAFENINPIPHIEAF